MRDMDGGGHGKGEGEGNRTGGGGGVRGRDGEQGSERGEVRDRGR